MRPIPIFAAALAFAVPAQAHVTVWPKTSSLGAHEQYEVRVPNERQVDTVAIEVRFPTALKITSFEQKPGWNTELIRDASGAIAGVRWSGSLAAMQFTQFGLLATNPAHGSELVWSATQVYADGTKIEWSGPSNSKTPAPRVSLTAAVR